MTLLAVEDARGRILAGVDPTPAEEIALAAAAGRTLATAVVATRAQPPFAASAMDGYAVRAADAPAGATLRLTGESTAGRRHKGTVGAGEAVRIYTGAPVPDGADAILIQENADAAGPAIIVREAPAPGRFIRPEGLDFAAGARLLPAGRRLGAREMALAAAANAAVLSVRRRPLVAVLSIGDELVPPGGAPGPDQIIGSSAAGIAAIIAAAGATAIDLGIALDRPADVIAAAKRAEAAHADVLVTLGGASVGDYDVVRPALAAAGMTLDFWRIAMRPGRPMLFGALGQMRVLGLPGNPVSALVCALLFLRPLIAALLGEPQADETESAVTGAPLAANDGREDYLRATLRRREDGLPVATPLPRQDSSMLSALADADCLLIRPVNAHAEPVGAPCRILRLP
ncbi:MAG: molybdopterin molybdotransferase MoeA [Bauldia sp.]|nr:molybdopterin molybdotransferase MoeA [Bauldia sp.]